MNYAPCKPTCQAPLREILLDIACPIRYRMGMKTKDAVKLAGSKSELARILGIRRQAIIQWGVKMPPLRVFQLAEKRPEWFK